MKIGILKETKIPADSRVPLSPAQCRHLQEEFPGIRIIVQPSQSRCFPDPDYVKEGIELSDDLRSCDVLLGVKEVKPHFLIPDKTYFFFSHTIKKQSHNKALLQAILEKHIRLVDYEVLTNKNDARIIGFGRWAGLVGTYNGIRAWCLRQGNNELIPPLDCKGLEDMTDRASKLELAPVRIAMTGDGRVAGGVEEMLLAFGVKKVTVEDYLTYDNFKVPVYAQLDPSKYNVSRKGEVFDLRHFFNHPEAFANDFTRYCTKTDILIMAAYWDPRAPVLFTTEDMRKTDFNIRVIADITCDIKGSVPSSLRTTSFDKPFYDYNPDSEMEEVPFSRPDNITVMTIDNLPCGLPREASVDFGHHIIKSILPLLLGEGPEDIIERATITKDGKLTDRYHYLEEWVYSK